MVKISDLNFTVRRWLAHKLARLARRIYPTDPQVMSFYADLHIEAMITGGAVIKVSPHNFYALNTDPSDAHFKDPAKWFLPDSEAKK